MKDSASAKAIKARVDAWKADMPLDDDDWLWDWIDALDDASRLALLAHCVSYGINALYERPNPYTGRLNIRVKTGHKGGVCHEWVYFLAFSML